MESLPVDIVLATNRVGPFLAQTLQSVKAQTYPHWRLIVVDDGSPDPNEVQRAVEGLPSATVVRQANAGPAAARNRGAAVGDAPLIAFLDDDDLWDEDRLETQVAALLAHPDALAGYSAGRYIDGDGSEFGTGWTARTESPERLISGEAPLPRIVTLIVRRAVHEALGGLDETFRVAEDNEYILRLAIAGELVAVERPLVSYRRHGGNVSVVNTLEGRHASRRLLRERLDAHRDDPVLQRLLRANIERFESRAADECVRALADAVRRRDTERAAAEMRWAARSPGRTMASLVRAAFRRD